MRNNSDLVVKLFNLYYKSPSRDYIHKAVLDIDDEFERDELICLCYNIVQSLDLINENGVLTSSFSHTAYKYFGYKVTGIVNPKILKMIPSAIFADPLNNSQRYRLYADKFAFLYRLLDQITNQDIHILDYWNEHLDGEVYRLFGSIKSVTHQGSFTDMEGTPTVDVSDPRKDSEQ